MRLASVTLCALTRACSAQIPAGTPGETDGYSTMTVTETEQLSVVSGSSVTESTHPPWWQVPIVGGAVREMDWMLVAAGASAPTAPVFTSASESLILASVDCW